MTTYGTDFTNITSVLTTMWKLGISLVLVCYCSHFADEETKAEREEAASSWLERQTFALLALSVAKFLFAVPSCRLETCRAISDSSRSCGEDKAGWQEGEGPRLGALQGGRSGRAPGEDSVQVKV